MIRETKASEEELEKIKNILNKLQNVIVESSLTMGETLNIASSFFVSTMVVVDLSEEDIKELCHLAYEKTLVNKQKKKVKQ